MGFCVIRSAPAATAVLRDFDRFRCSLAAVSVPGLTRIMQAMRNALNAVTDSTDRADGALVWPRFSILVVDDEEGMRSFLGRVLAARCGRADCAASAEQARELFSRVHYDLVVLDITLPGMSGLAWLTELREGGFTGDVILITAFADVDAAIRALRAGAADFLLKPFRVDQMVSAIQRCFDRARLLRENFVLRREIEERGGAEAIVGDAPATRALRQLIQRVADMPSTVLLQGESGVGKEVAARALHRLSRRAGGPFVPVNCAAISPELIESELFGHVKGAFTGAAEAHNGLFYYAQGGTLFRLGARSAGGYPHHCRHQPRLGRGCEAGTLPPGSVLPPRCGQHHHYAAARAARGRADTGAAFLAPTGAAPGRAGAGAG
jgi:CheY-like chemotaxis protein